jgi:protein-tyrosine-phosphatase
MPDVLFLCTGNSCRSQMAEGWLRHLAGHRFHAFSAGLQPGIVHPLAIEAMREAGVDISGQQSKDVARFLGRHFSHIITVCDRAPVLPYLSRTLPPGALVDRRSRHRRRLARRAHARLPYRPRRN